MSPLSISLAVIALVVVLALLARDALHHQALRRFGRTARGRVTACREQSDDGGLYYAISYAFEAPQSKSGVMKYTGVQRGKRGLSPGDVVAVRYWLRNPSVSRIMGRAD